MTNIFKKLLAGLFRVKWWFLAILLIVSPFHAFLITWLKGSVSGASSPFITVAFGWREIFIFLIGLLTVVELFIKKTFPKFDLLDWFIIAYTVLALSWLPFQWGTKMQWLWGFRFDVIPLVLFLFVRHGNFENFRGEIFFRKLCLFVSAIVLSFGLLHALFLPQNFLTSFGYSTSRGPYQPAISISACQYLEHTDALCRATSTFGGPTRYGTYLLFVIGLLIPFILFHFKKTKGTFGVQFNRGFEWILLLMAVASTFLTFSRSVWIGLFVMGVTFFLWVVPRKWKIGVLLFGAGVIMLGALFLFLNVEDSSKWNISFFKSLFIRDISTNEHFAYAKEGVRVALENPLGMGLGTVGPASVHFQKFLTENWYLQIAIEMGLLGLALFLSILVMFFKKLLANKDDWVGRGLFLGLLGISVTGLFTHSFEETATVLLFFSIAGMHLAATSPPQPKADSEGP